MESQVSSLRAEKQRLAKELARSQQQRRETSQRLLEVESSVGLAKARVAASEGTLATVTTQQEYLQKEVDSLAAKKAEVAAQTELAAAKKGSFVCVQSPHPSVRMLSAVVLLPTAPAPVVADDPSIVLWRVPSRFLPPHLHPRLSITHTEGLEQRISALREREEMASTTMVASERAVQRLHAEAAVLTNELEAQRDLKQRAERAVAQVCTRPVHVCVVVAAAAVVVVVVVVVVCTCVRQHPNRTSPHTTRAAQKQAELELTQQELRDAGKLAPAAGAHPQSAANQNLRDQVESARARVAQLQDTYAQLQDEVNTTREAVADAEAAALKEAAVAGVTAQSAAEVWEALQETSRQEAEEREALEQARKEKVAAVNDLGVLENIVVQLRRLGYVVRSCGVIVAVAVAVAVLLPPPPPHPPSCRRSDELHLSVLRACCCCCCCHCCARCFGWVAVLML